MTQERRHDAAVKARLVAMANDDFDLPQLVG
jgi:hypothetical protein